MDNKRLSKKILGLDISTKCCGLALFEYETGKVLELKQISPKVKPLPKSKTEELFKKADLVKELIETYKNIGIFKIFIEEPLLSSNNVYTVGTLLRFNGIVSKICYDTLKVVPEYITTDKSRREGFPNLVQPNKQGKEVLFGSYPRKIDLKNNEELESNFDILRFYNKQGKLDKKMVVFNEVNKLFPKLPWLKDKKDNLKKENYDISDAITVCVAALRREGRIK